jgi:iron-sulfur cluster repair protein YtfE (RIC family)
LQQLSDEVLTHASIEEEVFYPQLMNYPETRAIVKEGVEEHHIVEGLLKELDAIDSHDDNWQAKLHVLQENLEHHMTEEEQKLFPKARKLMGAARLGDMAKQIADLKETAVM